MVAAHQELFAALGAVDADVLTRVFRGRCSLDADVAVRQDEVVFRAQRRVVVDIGQEVRLLVVLGIDVIELVRPHDAQHALPLREQAVHVHIAGVAQDVVLLVELHHRVGILRVHHRVLQLLVVTEGTAVDPDGTQFHVGARAVHRDLLRSLLLEAERGVVDIGTRAVAVHVELHQTVLRGRAHRQSHLHHVTVGVVGGELHVTRYQLAVLVGIGHRLARTETRLLRGDKEPLAAADAAHHRSRAVGNIAHLQRKLYREPGGLHVGGEGLVPDGGFRTVSQLQRLAGPTAAAPVHILERGLHAAGLPDTGIALPVAAPGSVQLQQQAVGGLGDIHTAFGHVHRQAVGRGTQLQLQGLNALLGEAVGVGLHATRHADGAREAAVTPDLHRRGGDRRVVGHEVEGALLVTPALYRRDGMSGTGDDPPVGVDDLRADERRTAPPFQKVHIDALAFQRQPVGLHLGHDLHRVAAHRQAGHGQAERPVGGTAARHRVRLLLNTVHPQRHRLGTRAGHGIGDGSRIVGAQPALRDTGGDVIAAREA